MFFWTTNNIQQVLLCFIKKLSNDAYGFEHIEVEKPIEFSSHLGLSSIQVMELAAYANSFFHLFDNPEPPALLRIYTLQGWASAILKSREQLNQFITFKTSGTSGESKLVTHSIENLEAEISYLQTIIPKPKQVISLVPSNHIYGFLFSVILPALWRVPVLFSKSVTKAQLNNNSFIIGTPFNWHYLHASLNQQPVKCWGVSASAPFNNNLYQSLSLQGFQITEIYGSTETAGVGYRKSADSAFTLFDYWNFQTDENRIVHKKTGKSFLLMDNIQIKSERIFMVEGRKDAAVQIAGNNVFLNQVKQKIISINNVSACEIFAKSDIAGVKLSASIYLQRNLKADQQHCLNKMQAELKPEEFPALIDFYKSN